MYLKSLRWALAVMAVFLAVSAVAIVVLASRAGIVLLRAPLLPCSTTRRSGSYSTFVRIRERCRPGPMQYKDTGLVEQR